MLQEVMIENGAPTLAGLKTGNIFAVKNKGEEIRDEICRLNRILTKRGLRMVPVRKMKRHTLIYLYRPDKLKEDLRSPEAACILSEKGYCCEDPETCVVQLVKHLAKDPEFPHEIGLFLGYPPSDVKCFMEHPHDGVKCVGCWKVYSNQEEAVRTFEEYRRCTEHYRKESQRGKTLEELIADNSEKMQFLDVAI
jgi:hypothetical protein